MKRIITLLLVLAMLSAQAGCDRSDTYVYSGEAEGGRWFFAEMWGNTAKPLPGSYEYTRTDKVYVNPTLTSGEERHAYSRGTLVRIEYDGEMYLASGMDVPVITNVYSVTLAPLPCAEGGLECCASYHTFPTWFRSEDIETLCLIQNKSEDEDHLFCITKAEDRGDIENVCSVLKREEKYVNQKLEDHVELSLYGDSFFEENVLYFIFFISSTTGDEYKINRLAVNDGVLGIDILKTKSGVMMEGIQWLILISLEREAANTINGYKITKVN